MNQFVANIPVTQQLHITELLYGMLQQLRGTSTIHHIPHS